MKIHFIFELVFNKYTTALALGELPVPKDERLVEQQTEETLGHL
jgi:hypothetical protein